MMFLNLKILKCKDEDEDEAKANHKKYLDILKAALKIVGGINEESLYIFCVAMINYESAKLIDDTDFEKIPKLSSVLEFKKFEPSKVKEAGKKLRILSNKDSSVKYQLKYVTV